MSTEHSNDCLEHKVIRRMSKLFWSVCLLRTALCSTITLTSRFCMRFDFGVLCTIWLLIIIIIHQDTTNNRPIPKLTYRPTIRLHNCFFSVFIVFCVYVFFCLLSTILFSLWLLLSINDDDDDDGLYQAFKKKLVLSSSGSWHDGKMSLIGCVLMNYYNNGFPT